MQSLVNEKWTRPTRLVMAVVAMSVLIAFAVYLAFPEIDPQRTYERGMAAVSEEDFSRAYREIESLKQIEPNAARLYTLRGALQLRLGDPRSAIRQLARVEPTDTVHDTAMLVGGESFYLLHQFAEAEACLLPLSQRQPDLVQPHRWLASIYYDLGAMPLALAELDHVIRLALDDYRPWHLKGIIFSDLEQPAQAAESFQRALDLQPPDDKRSQIVRKLARNLIENLQYAEALELLDHSIGDHQADATMTALRGECLWSRGNHDLARQICDKALELDPDDRAAVLLKLRICNEDNEYAEIIEPLKRLLKQDAHDYEIRYQLALALKQIGSADESAEQLKLMEASRALKERAAELNAEANQHVNNPEVRDELARIFVKLGKPKLAEMWQRAADAIRKRQSIRNRTAGHGTAREGNWSP